MFGYIGISPIKFTLLEDYLSILKFVRINLKTLLIFLFITKKMLNPGQWSFGINKVD